VIGQKKSRSRNPTGGERRLHNSGGKKKGRVLSVEDVSGEQEKKDAWLNHRRAVLEGENCNARGRGVGHYSG